MPDPNVEPTSAPGGAMRKMSLTEAERRLIEDHRRKTAVDREFNAGLDHAIECCEDYWDNGSETKDFSGLIAAINKARRNV